MVVKMRRLAKSIKQKDSRGTLIGVIYSCNHCGSRMEKPWGTCPFCGIHIAQPILWRKDRNQCGCGKKDCE